MEKKGNKVDPGWNDPPMLNYNPSNPPPKSRITNKRIPFPLTSSNPSKSQMLPSGTVPPVSSTVSKPPTTSPPKSSSSSESNSHLSDK